jgi:predicted nucleic acid-binding protein
MSDGKVRKTLTLDPDIVEVLGSDPAALSATVNALLREEVERRKRRASLKELVEELEDYYGPADPEDVERARQAMRQAKGEGQGP